MFSLFSYLFSTEPLSEPLYKTIQLPLTDPNYKRLSELIINEFPTADIMMIEKITKTQSENNSIKLKQYNIIELFHGTKNENIQSILTKGFLCSKNVRSLYGYGTYFSTKPSISYGYTNYHGICIMFICDIIIDNNVKCAHGGLYYVVSKDENIIPKYIVYFDHNNK